MISPQPTLRYLYSAVTLLMGWCCLTAGRASAECGDYVTLTNTPHHSPHEGRQASTHNPSNSSQHPLQHPIVDGSAEVGTPVPFELPCHGPGCSRLPAREFPPLVPVSPVSSRAKEAAQPVLPFDHGFLASSSFDCDLTSLRPIDRASSVFHPPRLD
jgi:hypothetical protein